ncbi:MAG: ABC transporter ATP-binding protein [Chloroflexota bacterium]
MTGDVPALELRGVRVRYRDRLTLDLETLAVAPGERVAIVGPNGAGKTTLLHVAALLLDPEAGEVRLGGEAAAGRNRERLRRQTAILLQQPALFRATALENVALGPRLRGAARGEARAAARDWRSRGGAEPRAGRRPATLSGGEARRVALARAFAAGPRLLLLDEPFSPLDAATRAALLPDLAGALSDSGAAAVLVTHDLREAAAFGDRLGVLLAGRLEQIGAPAGTLARPGSLAAARVLGVENLLPGVAVRDGAGWAFRSPAGTVRCDGAAAGVADGAPCWLAARAGAIRLEAAGAPGSLACRVVSSEATPDGWLVRLDGPAPMLAMAGWEAAPPEPGASASAAVPAPLAWIVAG